MTFRNTQERYKYIYGSSVRKLDEPEIRFQSKQSAAPKPQKGNIEASHKNESKIKKHKLFRNNPKNADKVSSAATKRKIKRKATIVKEEYEMPGDPVINPRIEARAKALENNKKLKAFDKRYTFITLFAVLMCVLASVYFVRGTIKIHDLGKKVQELKKQEETLMGEKEALTAEIEKSVNLNDVAKYAKEELHMTIPDSKHIIYYYDDSGDYLRQY